MDTHMYILKRKSNAEQVKGKIVNILNKHGLNVTGLVVYNGSAISIEDKDWNIRMWIRLAWDINAETCVIYMSNIKFSDRLQRRGLFTEIINALKKHKHISNIVVQSVSTDAMRNWCKKHRFITNEYESDYYWKAFSY